MKKFIALLLLSIVNLAVLSGQELDSGTLMSGSDLSYIHAAKKEIDTYLKSQCAQLNAAKRAMILEYGLIDEDSKTANKRNVVGLKRVQGWSAIMALNYGCTEKNYYDFTEFFNIKTK